ncbi:hypothetical protein F4680DRAFT_445764 [Xylaria scruposa]|nr:hypothetical protein F4680DRAFT_445764 [Xylaria scruposa]
MEPPAKRPRLVGDIRSDAPQSTDASQRYHNSPQPSNRFEGYGVQNTGNLTISGDLTMHINERSNTSTGVNKRQILLLESLQFDQMDARQLTIKKAHAHTCAWFLDSPLYIDWAKNTMRNDHNFLWIKGKPGAGKSTLMKFLLKNLRDRIRKAGNQEILISFFFNARGDDLEKTTAGMYRSLLLQLLEARPNLRYVLDSIRIGHVWTIGSLKSLFEEVLQGLGDTSILCLIDALDECEEAQIRDMVSFLSDPGVLSNRHRICFASRHYPHITIKIGRNLILEEQIGHSQDIESYLHNALVIEDVTLAEQIRCDLQKKACGVFMWVVLVVGILNEEYDAGREDDLRVRIQQLPGDLHDLFLDILTRDKNNMDGLLLCIQCVLFARRPLTPEQLCFAIISKLEPHKLSHYHSHNISADNIKRRILNNSKGLVESTGSRRPTIQFIHESVSDFLLKENGFGRLWPSISTNVFGLSHDALKQCCQAYISMHEAVDCQGSPRFSQRFPFIDYAYREILFHSNQAQRYNVCQQDFLATFPRLGWIKHHNLLERAPERLYTPKASLLYILAETGMAALIRAHKNRQSCFKVEDERYGLPILAASATKSHEAIQTMLELETERLSEASFAKLTSMMPPNLDISCTSNEYCEFSKERGLLHQLVEYGNEKMSIFFLAVENCDIDVKNKQGMSILLLAAEKGFVALVNALLDSGADILAVNDKGKSPLHVAIIYGHIEVVRLLIDRGADISAINNYELSPFHEAIFNGHIDVVRLLIGRGAGISVTDRNGSSLLHAAINHNYFIYNHIEVMRLLIDRGADISATDHNGSSLLHAAAGHGDVGAIKLLIDRGADISATDHNGSSLLHAAINDNYITHSDIIELLIDRGADVSATDKFGRSPLQRAISKGHIGTAKLLIKSGADLSAVDDHGETALTLASKLEPKYLGFTEVVEMILKRGAEG